MAALSSHVEDPDAPALWTLLSRGSVAIVGAPSSTWVLSAPMSGDLLQFCSWTFNHHQPVARVWYIKRILYDTELAL
jgi:hypothetical protein